MFDSVNPSAGLSWKHSLVHLADLWVQRLHRLPLNTEKHKISGKKIKKCQITLLSFIDYVHSPSLRPLLEDPVVPLFLCHPKKKE